MRPTYFLAAIRAWLIDQMPIYTDAMGNKIYVDDEDSARQPPATFSTPTPTKLLMNKVTHLPPHKAAAMASPRNVSECEEKENTSDNTKPGLVKTSSNNVMFQAVATTDRKSVV